MSIAQFPNIPNETDRYNHSFVFIYATWNSYFNGFFRRRANILPRTPLVCVIFRPRKAHVWLSNFSLRDIYPELIFGKPKSCRIRRLIEFDLMRDYNVISQSVWLCISNSRNRQNGPSHFIKNDNFSWSIWPIINK